jgi:hypothetical protein
MHLPSLKCSSAVLVGFFVVFEGLRMPLYIASCDLCALLRPFSLAFGYGASPLYIDASRGFYT